MKLENFIKKLEEIRVEQGENLEVVMTGNMPVVEPVFSEEYLGKKVIITDEK